MLLRECPGGRASGGRFSLGAEYEEDGSAAAAPTIPRVGGFLKAWRPGRVALVVGALVVMLVRGSCGSAHSASAASNAVPVESYQHVPGPPFGVVTTRDGRYAFVTLASDRPGARNVTRRTRVLVYSLAGSAPRLLRTIRVLGVALGCSLTADGRLLLVANDGQGAAVLSVARAESGRRDPVLGTLSPPAKAHLNAGGAIETASSADGRYVFVSLEYGPSGGVVAIYDLGSSSAPRFGQSDYKGAIRLGQAVVGSALAPNGRYLYVTSEIANQARTSPSAIGSDGTLSVINVAIAEHDPAHAVLRTVPALSQPVRVAVSPDGSVVWVTARASDRLLGFSPAKLLTDPGRSLLANVRVGASPVGVAVFGHGNRVIVTNSDRFNQKGAHASLTVVNAKAALAHKPAVIATLMAGQFPGEMAVERNGTVVLVTNFASDQLEAVDVAHLR